MLAERQASRQTQRYRAGWQTEASGGVWSIRTCAVAVFSSRTTLPVSVVALSACGINSVPTAENIVHYVRLVREKATLRRLITACAEIQSRAFGEFGNYEEYLDEAENAFLHSSDLDRAIRLAGEPASPLDPPSGCRCHSRAARRTRAGRGFRCRARS